jgi:hypothetical protein
MKIREVALIFGLVSSASAVYALILIKFGLGHILGEFFTNSSGHPDFCLHSRTGTPCFNEHVSHCFGGNFSQNSEIETAIRVRMPVKIDIFIQIKGKFT